MNKILVLLTGFVLMSCTGSNHSHVAEDHQAEVAKDAVNDTPEITLVGDSLDSEFERLVTGTKGQDALVIVYPYQTIKRIFDTYNAYQESTDSPANLDSLRQSLKILETSAVELEVLTLVINVWMYYTVTDFSTRRYTQNVLRAHREESLQAIKNRIDNKMEWESPGSAPYSDLSNLLKSMEDE